MRTLRMLLLSIALLAAAPAAFTPYLVKDISPDNAASYGPQSLMALGENVLFFAQDADGPALWRSDGTEAGTMVVKRGLPLQYSTDWTASANRVLFEVHYRDEGVSTLWASDGGEAGTVRLTPDGVGSLGGLYGPLTHLGSQVFFYGWSEEHGTELWITNGTRAGTRLVADLNPGPGSSWPGCFTTFRRKLWFGVGSRLWKSDGTAAGTAVAFRLPRPKPDLHLCPLTTFGGRLLFLVYRLRSPRYEIWTTDGTVAGTERIDASQKFDGVLAVHRGRLWFTSSHQLWSTDGTNAGTRLALGLPRLAAPHQMMSDGTSLYFCVDEQYDAEYDEVWVTDGTEAGTRMIPGLDHCGTWKVMSGRLYLVGGTDQTLYRTDGTAARARPVRPDGEPDGVTDLVPFGNRLIAFTVDGNVWQTDGTAAGTKLMRRGLSPTNRCCGWQTVKAGPRLFFPGWEEKTGWELWAMHE